MIATVSGDSLSQSDLTAAATLQCHVRLEVGKQMMRGWFSEVRRSLQLVEWTQDAPTKTDAPHDYIITVQES